MKRIEESEPTGDDIIIRYEDNFGRTTSTKLFVKFLSFQSLQNDRWEGLWNGNPIWVEVERKGYKTIFSESFPKQFEYEAEKEVKRITRRFN